MNTTLRKAEKADLPALNRISLASKRYWNYPDHWIEKWKPMLRVRASDLQNQTFLILENEREIMGFSALYEEEQYFEITHFWILPTYIGQGYGKLLMKKLLEYSVNTTKDIIVEADPNAVPFYESQGFVTYDRVESNPSGRYLPLMKRKFYG